MSEESEVSDLPSHIYGCKRCGTLLDREPDTCPVCSLRRKLRDIEAALETPLEGEKGDDS